MNGFFNCQATINVNLKHLNAFCDWCLNMSVTKTKANVVKVSRSVFDANLNGVYVSAFGQLTLALPPA